VTEEDAEHGRSLEVCLDEIERCQPFFVGLLGERYGSVPSRYQVPDEPHYDWLRAFEPGHSITSLEIYHGVLRNLAMATRAFFYFRDAGYIETLPEEERHAYRSESEAAARKLLRLKDVIRSRCRVVEYQGPDEAFGQMVLEDLWAAIQAEFPQQDLPPDELANERSYHDAFIESRCQRFIGRRDLLARLTEYAGSSSAVPLIVTGDPGSGKSALLANFVRQCVSDFPGAFVLGHFIGASPGSSDAGQTLRRLCRELVKAFNLEAPAPEEHAELRVWFVKALEKAPASGTRIILVLDGLNQLDKTYGTDPLDWIPERLPLGVRIVASAGSGWHLDRLRRRRSRPIEVIVGEFEQADRRELVTQILWDYRKRLDETQLQILLSKPNSSNPLFLTVACEELRIVGEFERITDCVRGLPGDLTTLFGTMLTRIELDHGEELARSALALLAISRNGLLETELLDLLKRGGEQQLPRVLWARLYRSLLPYLRPAGEAGLLGFMHSQLEDAVQRRYMPTGSKKALLHSRLASYFRGQADPLGNLRWDRAAVRALAELPYQQCLAGMWDDGIRLTLCNLAFIEAKAAAGMAYELAADYGFVMAALPEFAAASELSRKLSEDVDNFGQALVRYATCRTGILAESIRTGISTRGSSGELAPLPSAPILVPLSAPPDAGVADQGVAADVEAFARFTSAQVCHLARYAGVPGFCVQQAYNFALSGPVASAARLALDSPDFVAPVLLLGDQCRPAFSRGSALKQQLLGHKGPVTAVGLSANGSNAISASLDGTARVWNLRSGACEQVLEGYRGFVSRAAIAADGAVAVTVDGTTTGNEYRVRVWDLATGQCRRTLDCGGASYPSAAVTADGRLVVVSANDRIWVWDAETGSCLRTIWTERTGDVDMNSDGSWVTTAGKAVWVWDLVRGESRQLNWRVGEHFHVSDYSGLAYVVGKCLVVDLPSGPQSSPRWLRHRASIIGFTLTPDFGLAVCLCDDASMWVWDVRRGVTLHVHSVPKSKYGPMANPISVSADGAVAVMGGDDGTLTVWDLTQEDLKHPAIEDDLKAICASPPGFTSWHRVDRALALGTFLRGQSNTWIMRRWNHQLGTCTEELRANDAGIAVPASTPDGRCVVFSAGQEFAGAGGFGVELFDIDTHRSHKWYGVRKEPFFLAISPNGRLVAGARDQSVGLWDLGTGTLLRSSAMNGDVMSMEFTKDGRRLVGSDSKGLFAWDLETDQIEIGRQGRIGRICLSPSGQELICLEGTFDSGTLERKRSLSIPAGNVWSLTPDGGYVVVATDDHTLELWELATERRAMVIGLAQTAVALACGAGVIAAGGRRGNLQFFTLRNLAATQPIVTARRIWRHRPIGRVHGWLLLLNGPAAEKLAYLLVLAYALAPFWVFTHTIRYRGWPVGLAFLVIELPVLPLLYWLAGGGLRVNLKPRGKFATGYTGVCPNCGFENLVSVQECAACKQPITFNSVRTEEARIPGPARSPRESFFWFCSKIPAAILFGWIRPSFFRQIRNEYRATKRKELEYSDLVNNATFKAHVGRIETLVSQCDMEEARRLVEEWPTIAGVDPNLLLAL
jgi:telomerase protein component 1